MLLQVGATAAVLIASAAAELSAELKRQEEETDVSASPQTSTSPSSGAMIVSAPPASHSSAPPDIERATRKVMAELEKHALEEEKRGVEDEAFLDNAMRRPRAQSDAILPKLQQRTSLRAKPSIGGSGGGGNVRPASERWKAGIMGSGGGSGVVGATPLGVQCFTCTVGKKPSQARTYVNDIDEVRKALRTRGLGMGGDGKTGSGGKGLRDGSCAGAFLEFILTV